MCKHDQLESCLVAVPTCGNIFSDVSVCPECNGSLMDMHISFLDMVDDVIFE